MKIKLSISHFIGAVMLALLSIIVSSHLLDDQLHQTIWFELGLFAICGLLALLLLRIWVVKPLENIAAQTMLLGSQVFDSSLNTRSLISEIHIIQKSQQNCHERLLAFAKDAKLMQRIFESHEGVLISDANSVILRVNSTFSRITGYLAEEVIGKKPSMFRSNYQDDAFYQQFWQSLNDDGYWQGQIWNRHKDGHVFPVLQTISALKNDAGEVENYIAVFVDIGKQVFAEQQLEQQSNFDPLTHLPNRNGLQAYLNQEIGRAFNSRQIGTLIYFDIDRLRYLNESFGSELCDNLLIEISLRLKELLGEGCYVARINGDEFVALPIIAEQQDLHLAKLASSQLARSVANGLQQAISVNGLQLYIGMSIGIAAFGNRLQSAEDVIRQAENAMFQAKAAGRGNVAMYFKENEQNHLQQIALQSELYSAIQAKVLVLFYQPQVNQKGELIGAEALIRWPHADKGMISPVQFIPLAEDTGLILPLGEQVISMAITAMVSWVKRYRIPRDFRLAINISARQFDQPHFVEQFREQLGRANLSARYFELEITESLLAHNVGDVINKLNSLKALGFTISVDDFGTGYSSLSYLKNLPLNKLKIDQSFVRDLPDGKSDVRITRAIISLAQSLGLKVLAEGVETSEQQLFLQENGCVLYQGYHFAKPLPENEFVTWFK